MKSLRIFLIVFAFSLPIQANEWFEGENLLVAPPIVKLSTLTQKMNPAGNPLYGKVNLAAAQIPM